MGKYTFNKMCDCIDTMFNIGWFYNHGLSAKIRSNCELLCRLDRSEMELVMNLWRDTFEMICCDLGLDAEIEWTHAKYGKITSESYMKHYLKNNDGEDLTSEQWFDQFQIAISRHIGYWEFESLIHAHWLYLNWLNPNRMQ